MTESKEPTKEPSQEEESAPSPEEKKKADSNQNKIFFGIVVILIIFFALVFWFFKMQLQPEESTPGSNIQELTYNGFQFAYFPDADIWKSQWQRDDELFNIYFHFSPEEAEEVPIVQVNELSPVFRAPAFYMTFDALDGNITPYFQIATLELKLALERVFERTLIGACVENNTQACHDRPIKNCDNTIEPIFYLKQSGEASITLDDNCIIITGSDQELVKAVDRLLYHWYRIIPEDVTIVEEEIDPSLATGDLAVAKNG